MIKTNKAFTVFEIVIACFVTILIAAMLVASMPSTLRKARGQEAATALRAIRNAMNLNFNKTLDYRLKSDGTNFPATPFNVVGNIPGYEKAGCLTGSYYKDSDNRVLGLGANIFTVRAYGTRPGVQNVDLMIRESGDVFWIPLPN